MEIIEPHPYGDNFSTVNELADAVNQRLASKLPLYGHAIIYPQDSQGNIISRIGARVNPNGDITVGVHCEWI